MDDRSSGIPIEEELICACGNELQTEREKYEGWCFSCIKFFCKLTQKLKESLR